MNTSLHLRPPFRAEHVGSLYRPATLYEKRQLFEDGKCSAEDLKLAEDEAVVQAVKLQKELGMRTITDGEFRRGMFFEGVFDNLEGMTVMPQRPIHEWKEYIPHIAYMYAAGVPAAETIFCSGKIKRTKPFYVDQFTYLKSVVPPEDVPFLKVNMCSPSWFHQRHGSDLTYDLNVYKNDDEYFEDLGIAYREEISELYALGCRYIQIDDPTFCYFCHEAMISGMEKAGVDHDALLDTYIKAINVCTQNRPKDLTVSVHMCRGNFKGAHFSEGGYERIAKKVFNNLDVDVFFLEYDTERCGSFQPLSHLPPNKVAVLGLVTTKVPQLETVEELKAKVYEAAKIISEEGNPKRSMEAALNQLAISPQCGFASVWQGNPITEEDQKKKLKLLVETAKQIWGSEM